MSLDITLTAQRTVDVYNINITHNLVPMAKAAGIYDELWHPVTVGITKAKQLQLPLILAITIMENSPEEFKKLNPENGWGSYDSFFRTLCELFEACKKNPDAKIEAWS